MASEKKMGIGEEIAKKNNERCARCRTAFDRVLAVLEEMEPDERGTVIRTVAAFYGQGL